MRIDRVQNCAAFGQLQIRTHNSSYLWNKSTLGSCEKQLANTSFVDVVIDSYGLAIKKKMTDVLYRIQSFSLFPEEQAVGIRMIDEKNPLFKFFYATKAEARSEWDDLCKVKNEKNLELYTKVALWVEERLANYKRVL